MGVQALRTVVPLQKKETIVFSTPASGAVVAPGPNQVAVISMLAAADIHRTLEVQARVRECIQFFRQVDFGSDIGIDEAIIIPIDGGKGKIIRTGALSNIQTGTVAITMDTLLTFPGAKNWVVNALTQTLDWMNEQDRLTV